MMRNLYRWTLIGIFLVLILLGSRTVYADQKELITLEEKTDIIILVGYENDQPAIRIIGPDNTEYSHDDDYTVVARTQGLDYYCIADAAAGKWFIDCDKKNNETVSIDVNRWYRSISIESFSYERKQDNISAKIYVKSDTNLNYDWYLYAAVKDADGVVTGQKELKKAWGSSNEEVSTNASIQGLPAGDYYLISEVVYEYSDGTEVSDKWEAEEPISVKENSQTEDADFITTLNLTNHLLSVDWSNLEEKGSFIAAIIQGDEAEPLYYEKYESGESSCEAFIDFETAVNPKVVLTPLNYDGSYDRQYTRTVPLDPGVEISVDTESVTADQMMTISYNTNGKEVPLELTINGKKQEYRLNGDGTVSTLLEDMEENEIELRYHTEENCYYRMNYTITVNSLPPFITLYGISDSIVTEEAAIPLAGVAEHAAELLVNGKAVELAEDGTFYTEVQITNQDKTIEFVGISENGVRAVKTIEVIHGKGERAPATSLNKDSWSPIPFLTSFGTALILGFFLIFLGVMMNRHMSNGKLIFRMVTAFLIIGVITGIMVCVYCFVRFKSVESQISGVNLVSVLKESYYIGLQRHLKERDLWIERCRLSGVITGIVLALFIALEAAYKIGRSVIGKTQRRGRAKNLRNKPYQFVSKNKKDIYCPECGTKNRADARFCGKCGQSLLDDDSE